MRSSISAGSRVVGSAALARFFGSRSAADASTRRRPSSDEHPVDRAELPRERRVGRYSESDRLAVHRAAGGHDEVGERHEALCVDRPLGHVDRGQRSRGDLSALIGRPWKDDGVDSRVAPEPLENVSEERVRLAVVQRDVRRSSHDDDGALAIQPELIEDSRVGRESVEVVLLLQARVAANLRGACTEAVEAVLGDRLRDDDTPRRPAAEAVLDARELVVEGVRGRDPERTSDHRQLVRGVREREVELAAPCVAAERVQPTGHRTRLPECSGASVPWPDDVVLDAVQREKLRRLRVFPRREGYIVPALAQQRDQRPEERHLRRVRDVDPHAHAATVADESTVGRQICMQ